MSRAYRRPQELVEIYNLHQDGLSTKEIVQKTGLPAGSIATVLHQLKRYMTGKTRDQSRQSSNYRAAVKEIRKQRRENTEDTVPSNGNLASLKAAFAQFEKAMAQFIDAEIHSRCGALQRENEQLKRRMEEPVNLNWIDALVENPKEDK